MLNYLSFFKKIVRNKKKSQYFISKLFRRFGRTFFNKKENLKKGLLYECS